jgi:hypothetical protein
LRLRLSPNRPKSSLIWPMSPQSSIGVLKTISVPMVGFSHLGHLSCTKINTISKQTKRSFHLTHITYKFHRVRPKRFSSLLHVRYKPCTNLVWRLTLSPNGPKRASIWPTHVTTEVHWVRPKKIPCPWYIRRKPCSYLAPSLTSSPRGPSEHLLDPHHLGVPLGAPKMISKPITRLEQMGHLSCVKISTISKETEMSFHLTHIT